MARCKATLAEIRDRLNSKEVATMEAGQSPAFR